MSLKNIYPLYINEKILSDPYRFRRYSRGSTFSWQTVLVTRDTTERPEAVEAGTVKLVGTDPDAIHHQVIKLLDNQDYYNEMSEAHNPYGDGKTSQYIATAFQNIWVANKASR